MTKDDKWGMFRQFMYNELGISKEMIREWIREAVSEQVSLLVANTYNTFNIENFLKRELMLKANNNLLISQIQNEVAKDLAKRINLTCKIKE